MWTYDFWLGAIWTVICILIGVVVTCVGLYVWDRLYPEPPPEDPWDEWFILDEPPGLWTKEEV